MSEIIKSVTLEQHKLTSATIYAYCPYCVRTERQKGVNDDVIVGKLHKLTYLKKCEYFKNTDGEIKTNIATFYVCDDCGRKMTVEDFENAYTCRADGSKWTEKPVGYEKGAYL